VSDLDVKIVAIETGSAAYARFERRALVSNPTGTAQLVQTLIPTPDKLTGVSGWTVTAGVSGGNFEVVVVGNPTSALDIVKWEAIITPTQLTF
jgi:hypothetical protein